MSRCRNNLQCRRNKAYSRDINLLILFYILRLNLHSRYSFAHETTSSKNPYIALFRDDIINAVYSVRGADLFDQILQ